MPILVFQMNDVVSQNANTLFTNIPRKQIVLTIEKDETKVHIGQEAITIPTSQIQGETPHEEVSK